MKYKKIMMKNKLLWCSCIIKINYSYHFQITITNSRTKWKYLKPFDTTHSYY